MTPETDEKKNEMIVAEPADDRKIQIAFSGLQTWEDYEEEQRYLAQNEASHSPLSPRYKKALAIIGVVVISSISSAIVAQIYSATDQKQNPPNTSQIKK